MSKQVITNTFLISNHVECALAFDANGHQIKVLQFKCDWSCQASKNTVEKRKAFLYFYDHEDGALSFPAESHATSLFERNSDGVDLNCLYENLKNNNDDAQFVGFLSNDEARLLMFFVETVKGKVSKLSHCKGDEVIDAILGVINSDFSKFDNMFAVVLSNLPQTQESLTYQRGLLQKTYGTKRNLKRKTL